MTSLPKAEKNKVLEKHKESNKSVTTLFPPNIGAAELETRCKWRSTWEGSGTVWDLKYVLKQGAGLQIRMILYDFLQTSKHCPSGPHCMNTQTTTMGFPPCPVGWHLAQHTVQPCPGAQADLNNERFASL